MKLKPLPKQEYLHAILDYDPDTGVFTWRSRPHLPCGWDRKWAGKVAGTRLAKGIVIYVDSMPFLAHRLAWVYAHGDVLDGKTLVDHENCDCYDNRLDNLRPATHGQNGSNSRGWAKKALPKGVSTTPSGKPYRARIGVDGKVLNLGVFDTPEEAHAAYLQAAILAKAEFARGH